METGSSLAKINASVADPTERRRKVLSLDYRVKLLLSRLDPESTAKLESPAILEIEKVIRSAAKIAVG
ncbi:MAG TPA: hypothetical protein VLM90_12785, partial [Candidatus Deferrimicrobium sp.]|nr:hypothetical protein [Candidatus Deferrimicrobium sp.]